jgi:ABC-type transport system involved in multi-copper enzyme maturation permease subunit
MLATIIKREILETILSPKFVFTFAVCAVLILLSTFAGVLDYRTELAEYNAAVALNKTNLESQPNYMTLAGIGTKITRPPQVLGVLSSGIQGAVGRRATVNIAYDPSLVDSKYNSNPVLAIFGELDLTLIVKIVLSLFAILFTYDSISGERERGVLKLNLSYNVPRDKLILGKSIGLFTIFLITVTIPLLLHIIILQISPNLSLGAEDWIRIGTIFVSFLLYISIFFSLGVLISTITNRSAASLFVLLCIWVVIIIIIPKVSVLLARQINPIPSVHQVTAEKDAYLLEIQSSTMQQVNDWRQANPPDSTPDFQEKFKQFITDLQNESVRLIEVKNTELEEEYQGKRRRQQALALNLSRLSPAAGLTFSTMSLAKTGLEEQERFLNSIRTYKPIFSGWANTKMMANLDMSGKSQMPKPDLNDMPRHDFRPQTFKDSLLLALPDLAIMALMVLLFAMGAFVSFIRYDVR